MLDQRLWKAAGIEQQKREESDPWDDILYDLIGAIDQDEERVLTKELYGTVLGFSNSKLRDIDAKRIGRCMRRLGWSGPKVMRVGNERGRGFSRSKKPEAGGNHD